MGNLAISHNNQQVKLYKESSKPGKWEATATLDQHDLRVTGIDWAPKTNRIVTCSADRNAYVWVKQDDGTWKHTLVLLRINRAATCVRWSPEENKFAVGSGAKIVSICYHQNQISELRYFSGDKASAGTISTVAGDGKLVLWDLAALKLKGLKI